MTQGVVIMAHNSAEIDYIKIACANALMIKKNLGVPVTIISDEGTMSWATTSLGKSFLDKCFQYIILVDVDYSFTNPRHFADTSFSSKVLPFYNCNHWEIYDLSPYEETLFIDADYLIMSSELNKCWGSKNDVMADYRIYTPSDCREPYYKKLDNMGIKTYWATVIYFRKSSLAENMFSLMRHVQENYKYFRDLYCISSSMFRNDYALSIAIHTLNGFSDTFTVIKELPIPGLLMSWDTNDIQNVNGVNDITLYAERSDIQGTYLLCRIKNIDVHIMNKWSINRSSDKLIGLYDV